MKQPIQYNVLFLVKNIKLHIWVHMVEQLSNMCTITSISPFLMFSTLINCSNFHYFPTSTYPPATNILLTWQTMNHYLHPNLTVHKLQT